MGDKKTKIVNFRLPENVYEKWKLSAQSHGVSFSDYVRSCVDTKQVTGISPPLKKGRNRKFSKADPELLLQIAKIGNNVNQIARWLNKSRGDIESIKLIAYLAAIRRDVQHLLPDEKLSTGAADAD